MRYTRVIPVLLFDDGGIYRSRKFLHHYRLGDPVSQLERYKSWDVDEIIYLDMHRARSGRRLIDFLPAIARDCFAPLAVGGGIKTTDEVHRHLDAGADRIVINTAALQNPDFITEVAHRFGAQAIIVSIDAVRTPNGVYEVVVGGGTTRTGRTPEGWAAEAAERGAGEIFINSVDRDGTGEGYDIELIRRVSEAVNVPVIACGGVGTFDDFVQGVTTGGANSVAAANIFAFKELSYFLAKDALTKAGIHIRASETAGKARQLFCP